MCRELILAEIFEIVAKDFQTIAKLFRQLADAECSRQNRQGTSHAEIGQKRALEDEDEHLQTKRSRTSHDAENEPSISQFSRLSETTTAGHDQSGPTRRVQQANTVALRKGARKR